MLAAVKKLKHVREEHNEMYSYSHVTLAGTDDRVSRDQLCELEDTTSSLDTDSKRVDRGRSRG